MKFLRSWLCDHLDGAPSADVFAERLTAAGLNVETRENVGDDEILDVDVTTNRPDAMNHRGLAREAVAAGCGTLKALAPVVPEGSTGAAELGKVTVVDPAGCPRYCARVIRGVTVGPSPAWLAERLERCGIRPINNVVDATNYVLLDLGQPLHAFDLDLLAGREIVVRRAATGERFTTLDGVERVLVAADLVIANRDRAVADQHVLGREGALDAVERRHLLGLAGAPHHDPAAGQRREVERVQRLAEVEKDVVGGVDDGVDRADAARLEARRQPRRRRA